MSIPLVAFLVLIAAFAIGSFTKINAGLIALVAAFGVGTLVAGLPLTEVISEFPSGLFFVLVGATLLFAIVRINGTIDLLAYWAERLAGQRKLLVPVLMFLLTAVLATAGAFTPAAIAIVAPVALALGSRFGISTLAMGLVVVQGANAGAFSPVNPFGVVANVMLDDAGASADSLQLFTSCFVFNALLAFVAYAAAQKIMGRRLRRAAEQSGEPRSENVTSAGAIGTALGTRAGVSVLTRPVKTAPVKVAATPIRVLTLGGLGVLLVLTTVLGIDVGVASFVVALALIVITRACRSRRWRACRGRPSCLSPGSSPT